MYPRVEEGEPISVAFGALFIGLAITMPSFNVVNRLVRDQETAIVSKQTLAFDEEAARQGFAHLALAVLLSHPTIPPDHTPSRHDTPRRQH